MKLHNVDSQSRSSGVDALDNSAMSASPVVQVIYLMCCNLALGIILI